MAIEIEIIPALQDNYIYLIHDKSSGKAAVVDPSDHRPVLKKLEKKGWNLTHIFNTHHHWDHTGGNMELKKKTGAAVVGFDGDSERIPGIDIKLSDGDIYRWHGYEISIIHIPGHTIGAIAFHFTNEKIIFTGDTLFTMGCGKLFEGTPEMMMASLKKLTSLPKETRIYSGHEYAEKNARFALSLEKRNKRLNERFKEITTTLNMGGAAQPSSIEDELKTNPFLRIKSREIRKNAKKKLFSSDMEIFASLREMKDNF